jgi:hypothetical protein
MIMAGRCDDEIVIMPVDVVMPVDVSVIMPVDVVVTDLHMRDTVPSRVYRTRIS